MDKAITVESLVALGMTEDEAARALEAAGAGAAEAVQPETPAEPEAPAEPEEAVDPEGTAEEEEPTEPEEPAEPEAPPEQPEPEAPTEPETPEESEAPANPDLSAENAALRDRLIAMGVRMSALALGVRPERAGIVQRLADTGGIDPTAEDAMSRIEEAVRKALAEVPELIGAGAVSTGALGAHPRGAGAAADPFTRGFGSL